MQRCRGAPVGTRPIEVGPEERVKVRLTPEAAFEEPLAAESVLEVRVMIGAAGEGRVRFRCTFTDGASEALNVPGSATFTADGRVRPVAVYCRVPAGMSEPIAATALIDLIGPIEARIGDATGRAVTPSLLSGTTQSKPP